MIYVIYVNYPDPLLTPQFCLKQAILVHGGWASMITVWKHNFIMLFTDFGDTQ